MTDVSRALGVDVDVWTCLDHDVNVAFHLSNCIANRSVESKDRKPNTIKRVAYFRHPLGNICELLNGP